MYFLSLFHKYYFVYFPFVLLFPCQRRYEVLKTVTRTHVRVLTKGPPPVTHAIARHTIAVKHSILADFSSYPFFLQFCTALVWDYRIRHLYCGFRSSHAQNSISRFTR